MASSFAHVGRGLERTHSFLHVVVAVVPLVRLRERVSGCGLRGTKGWWIIVGHGEHWWSASARPVIGLSVFVEWRGRVLRNLGLSVCVGLAGPHRMVYQDLYVPEAVAMVVQDMRYVADRCVVCSSPCVTRHP